MLKKHIFWAALLLSAGFCNPLQGKSMADKATNCQLFDFGWTFSQNGKSITVNLPHDWDIYHAPAADGATKTGGGYFPGGKGTYTKHFATPKGERVKLHFEGVYQQATILVNGEKAGQHGYGYTPFTIDVTPYLYKDKRMNELQVIVDNSQQPNCRWYSGSGIYRHVWLHTMPALHLSEHGLSVATPEVSAEGARVVVTAELQNDAAETRQIDDIEISFDGGTFTQTATGREAQAQWLRQQGRLEPGTSSTLRTEFAISKPRLWAPATPHLYTATVRLKQQGKVIDQQSVKFGIRTIDFDALNGFRLNGQPLKINGACVHHDDGVLGAMAFDAAEIRKVRLMKEAGFNLIRTSHNPTTRAFLDACDSLGMLVIDEAYDGWRTGKNAFDYHLLFDSCYQQDIAAMVMRDRNHPSVICWSIGNEVIERKDIRVITTARNLKKAILQHDATRPVTEALCAWDPDWDIYDPHAEVLDVVGYNYLIFKHKEDHARDPQRVIWQTESYPRDAFSNWQCVQQHPYIVGDIVWTGLDYLGESGIGRYFYEGETEGESWQAQQFPWHGAYCGDVDITGWRKPISHYRDMLWNDIQKPFLAVKEPDGYFGRVKLTKWSVWPTWESWTWPGWEGKPIEVEVYTKQPQVQLFLDDKLIATQQVSEQTGFKATFKMDYQPGRLKAVTAAGTAELATAGKAAALRLTPDRRAISGNGQDLAYVTLEVVDGQGRVVPDAAIDCEVTVSGTATLLAAATANLKDLEPKTSARVKTWKGRALIVVRAGQKRGTATVSIKSELPTASTRISTLAVKR